MLRAPEGCSSRLRPQDKPLAPAGGRSPGLCGGTMGISVLAGPGLLARGRTGRLCPRQGWSVPGLWEQPGCVEAKPLQRRAWERPLPAGWRSGSLFLGAANHRRDLN